MQVKVVSGSIDPLFDISDAARMCTNTQERNELKTREAFVRARIRNGEENLLEHAFVKLEIRGISRACLQQLVRHRYHVVYSVESQRYVDQTQAGYVIPPSIKGNLAAEQAFITSCEIALQTYKSLVNIGIKKEDARFCLPEAMKTNLQITYNFRGLRHLLRMRLDPKAQWEIRELAREIKRVVVEKYGTDFFAEGLNND